MNEIEIILEKTTLSKDDLVTLISLEGENRNILLKKAQLVAGKTIGNNVYYRGLVEFSNICSKDCFYCGIRKSNKKTERYNLSDSEILDAAKFAYKSQYGSLVLQSGEQTNPAFIGRIGKLLKSIKSLSNGQLGITISLGEQTEDTYQYWYNCGAHRYLLRIETSNKTLYNTIHPFDDNHSFEKRISCLQSLQKVGYQTGTGVMIGLPFQTYEDLADDLIFMKNFDVDMVGMGPYIEHEHTPLYKYKNKLWPLSRRLEVAINMIATLRILMPNINIVASTALQAIDPLGREKALKNGANIIMPNITPTNHRKDYLLYENKPCIDESANDCTNCINIRIEMAGKKVVLGQWGDSKHYFSRNKNL
ncbi:MAG: [FeFe] hydrogenase H-cluster radical SAM maturase HydE [Marinilabiliaceae bacterium]|nr:[FeFe] hydrogenase H-cluster radical SAM maturase HydE [Marinilabiliaceae bacterium]